VHEIPADEPETRNIWCRSAIVTERRAKHFGRAVPQMDDAAHSEAGTQHQRSGHGQIAGQVIGMLAAATPPGQQQS
jgi:hypothetical protein